MCVQLTVIPSKGEYLYMNVDTLYCWTYRIYVEAKPA